MNVNRDNKGILPGSSPPPVVVTATGGSGTRALATVMSRSGIFMGAELNRSEDAMPVARFLRKWLAPYLKHSLSQQESVHMKADFAAAIELHRSGVDAVDAPWGIKNPRLIMLLPFLLDVFPGMKVIHIVRDGRDMAFSKNQNQLRDYGDFFLDDSLRGAPLPVRSIALWSRLNLGARHFGMTRLEYAYLALRFETLCTQPAAVTRDLLSFVGARTQDAERLAEAVAPPATIGRWRGQPRALVAELERVAHDGLAAFGYLT